MKLYVDLLMTGGHGTMLVTLNSIVHVIMYGYYLLTTWDDSYKQSIWWKKHVTQVQIVSLLIPTMISFNLHEVDHQNNKI